MRFIYNLFNQITIKTYSVMKNLSNYELHEALNGLYNSLRLLETTYLHVNHVYTDIIIRIKNKITKIENELQKRFS